MTKKFEMGDHKIENNNTLYIAVCKLIMQRCEKNVCDLISKDFNPELFTDEELEKIATKLLSDKVSNAVQNQGLINTLRSFDDLDEDSKLEVLDAVFSNMRGQVYRVKSDICQRSYHEFTPWRKKNTTIYEYDTISDEYFSSAGLFWVRQCKYCGMIEKTRDVQERDMLSVRAKQKKMEYLARKALEEKGE